MTKLLAVIAILAAAFNVASAQNQKLHPRKVRNPKVAYVAATKLKQFPFPVVNIVREGLATTTDITEIMERIIYPTINKSRKPIASIIIEFYPNESHIGVMVIWHGVDYQSVLIERNSAGRFDPDAYKVFFEEIERE